MPSTPIRKYEVWIVQFDPSVGSEIQKKRPAVIVSPNILNSALQTVLVAPLTSRERNYYPSRMDTNFENNGGQIAADQIRCVDKSRLTKFIGVLPQDEHEDLNNLLVDMFGQE